MMSVEEKIIISVQGGVVTCEQSNGHIIELHDYDIQEEDNPNCRYGEDCNGVFEISEL
jgi:hypothetical protein